MFCELPKCDPLGVEVQAPTRSYEDLQSHLGDMSPTRDLSQKVVGARARAAAAQLL